MSRLCTYYDSSCVLYTNKHNLLSLSSLPAVLRQFVGLLEEKTSVEDFVEWGQSVLHTTVKVQ